MRAEGGMHWRAGLQRGVIPRWTRECIEALAVAPSPKLSVCCVQVLDMVRALKPACTSVEGFSVEALHAKLQAAGYIVELKHNGECAARNTGRRCLENLHHTYIVCRGSLANAVTVRQLLWGRCTLGSSHFNWRCLESRKIWPYVPRGTSQGCHGSVCCAVPTVLWVCVEWRCTE